MAADEFQVQTGADGDTIVITVTGDLDLATAPELQAAFDKAIASAPQTVRIDVGGLTFLDSSGISVLVKAHHELADAGAELVVHRVGDRIRRVLDVAGLADFFARSDQPAA